MEEYVEFRLRPQAGFGFSGRGKRLCSRPEVLRQALSEIVERADGAVALDRSGELECTPLQMANLAAIVANRGYYYIPHIVRSVEGRDSMDRRFYEKHYTKVDPKYFEPIVEGMWQSVHKEGGTSRTAYLPGLDVCGKTGTAQNPRGKDHSTFLSFAPKDNPRIAISVYVENGGFGASAALPIASLLEEYYLTDTVTRPWLVEMVKQKTIYYPAYGK